MITKDNNIYIIGAGISGLVAATVLEKHGFSPTVIEASESVGGRVKTDLVDGYQLDHGFQVLLSAYPAAQKFLDFDRLELQHFLPGAAIYKNGKKTVIGDPLRDFSLLFSTLFSGIGNFSDKIKILKLNAKLKKKTIAEIFNEEERTTFAYLKDFGFSSAMIADFFMPFFSGIFLESKLETSSRMFEFVYKMFGEGFATLPKAGIGAIPNQLYNNLNKTKFIFNTKVTSVKENEILLSDGTSLIGDAIIIATDANHLIPNLNQQKTNWKSCDTFYFETAERTIKKALIGLVTEKDSVINNIFYHTSLPTSNNNSKELLSVTVVDNQNLADDLLLERVQKELKEFCSITTARFIKCYKIPMALPKLTNLQYDLLPSETRLTNNIFLAGDTLLNGSLNAAMLSGEKAALGVIENL